MLLTGSACAAEPTNTRRLLTHLSRGRRTSIGMHVGGDVTRLPNFRSLWPAIKIETKSAGVNELLASVHKALRLLGVLLSVPVLPMLPHSRLSVQKHVDPDVISPKEGLISGCLGRD